MRAVGLLHWIKRRLARLGRGQVAGRAVQEERGAAGRGRTRGPRGGVDVDAAEAGYGVGLPEVARRAAIRGELGLASRVEQGQPPAAFGQAHARAVQRADLLSGRRWRRGRCAWRAEDVGWRT